MDSVRRIEDSIIGPEPSGEYCVDHYNYFGPETTTKGPFITTRWGQLWLFNQYHASAIYGPTIAVVQLMAYYNWPLPMQNYESQSITVFNWPEDRGYVFGPILQMYPEAVERVSRACHKVVNFLLENEGESYGVTVEAIKNTYGEYGYIADKMESYSSSLIRTDLDKARPVLMSGYSSTNWWDGDMGASGWIVDGYKDTYCSYQLVRTWYNAQNEVIDMGYFPVVPTSTKLLHINWGWDGRGDGYFLDGLFAPMQGDSYDFPTLGTTDDHHYRYTVKQLVNYRRQHDPK